ncbi:hypothetical protein EVAR_39878_1 [Eumeta japonica]|uniref:Uncharacterized protein n=1 Tax=Eumeta variegata TaxID=151549 RepID=A0A4C1WUK8_EUMVA|nr:hypothetical protein EVAR_39878_1 [Eumeta japonica]
MSVWGTAQFTSRGDSQAKCVRLGDILRATPSPMTLLRRGNPEGFHVFRAIGTPVPSGPLRRSLYRVRTKRAGSLKFEERLQGKKEKAPLVLTKKIKETNAADEPTLSQGRGKLIDFGRRGRAQCDCDGPRRVRG